MNKKITHKIIRRLFDRLGCPAVAVMKTPLAGQEVDNGMGVDFGLAPWAVIHKNDMQDNSYRKKIKWERENNSDIMMFCSEGCDINGLIEELKERDEYELLWKISDEYLTKSIAEDKK